VLAGCAVLCHAENATKRGFLLSTRAVSLP
jgi:hypothetical protein